jgi:hypothetical protein
MRTILCVALAVFVFHQSTNAMADRRVALVIGNSKYQHVPNLPNPANDASAVSLLLKSTGFDVVAIDNVGVGDMRRLVRDFSDRTRDADIAVIYYAGHGLEVGGINYLVPVDATLRRDIDVEDETVSLDRLLQVLEPAKRLRLVILDACRDNPFAKSMARTMASRAIGRGLARVEPVTSDTLIAFAAKAGMTAADGNSTHSPFTSALLKHIVTPGLDVRLAFGRVRDEVLANTRNKQEPFVYGSLGGNTVTLAARTREERPDSPPLGDPDAPAARDYEAAAKIGTISAWDSFLTKYPMGFYSDLAKDQRNRLKQSQPPTISKPTTDTKANSAVLSPPDDLQTKTQRRKQDANPKSGSSNMACCVAFYRRAGWPNFQIYGSSGSCRPGNLATINYCNPPRTLTGR